MRRLLPLLPLLAPLPAAAHDPLLDAVALQAQRPQGFGDWFALGVEHIFIGYDHLLFLAALVLVAQRFGELAKVITSFTIAHSITLALASLDVFSIPGWIVEPAIAASIVFVAVENILRKEPRGRYRLTFALGLVHGFGFAGVLSEVGLAEGDLAVGLAGFNLGVEAGQIFLVVFVAPLLMLLRRRPWYGEVAIPASSAIIGFFGAYWVVERILG